MQQELTEHNLVQQMILAFPELEPEYAELVRGDAPDTPHNYSGAAILGRYFRREADRGQVSALLQRCAEFFERASASSDDEAVNIIWIEIFEPLIFNPTHLRLMWPILGPKSKEHIRDAAQRWSKAVLFFHPDETDLPINHIPDK